MDIKPTIDFITSPNPSPPLPCNHSLYHMTFDFLLSKGVFPHPLILSMTM